MTVYVEAQPFADALNVSLDSRLFVAETYGRAEYA